MGCSVVVISRVGGDISTSFSKDGGVSPVYTRDGNAQVRFGLVCIPGDVERGFLYASDGLLLTVDGGRLIV